MKRLLIALLVLAFALPLAAETTKAKNGKKATSKTAAAAPSRATMEEMLKIWETLDPAKAAPYYVKGPSPFYDIAPLKYDSWADYEAGTKELFKTWKAPARFELNDDAKVHHAGNTAWGTATWRAEVDMTDGTTEKFDLRWTIIWEKRGDQWLIVHEHVSAPLPPAPPK